MATEVTTEAEAEKWIQRQLADGIVNVELTCGQLSDCLMASYRWFNDRKGLRAEYKLEIFSNISEYDLSALNPKVEEVLEVAFPRTTDIDLRAVYGDDLALPGVPWGMFPYGALQSGTYSSLVQALQYRETASRIMSSDLDWSFRKVKNPLLPLLPPAPKLYVTPGVNGPAGGAIVLYKARLRTIEDLGDDDRNKEFVLKRALAEAMMILGRGRRKYSSYPTARGERSLDGNELVSDAKELIQQLNDDILLVNMPMPFITK